MAVKLFPVILLTVLLLIDVVGYGLIFFTSQEVEYTVRIMPDGRIEPSSGNADDPLRRSGDTYFLNSILTNRIMVLKAIL